MGAEHPACTVTTTPQVRFASGYAALCYLAGTGHCLRARQETYPRHRMPPHRWCGTEGLGHWPVRPLCMHLSSLPKRSRPRRHGVDALHPVELRHSAAQKLFATRSVRRRTRQSPRSIIAVASIAKFHTAPDRGSPRNRHRVAPIQCRADTTAPCARRGLPRDLR